LAELKLEEREPILHHQILAFRAVVQRWQRATILSIDQLILTLSQDLFTEPSDLAVANKLAVILRRVTDINPGWGLAELANELDVIAKNERRFLGLSQDDIGFDPDQHRGEVVVATLHKAKGLEWNRVYLMSVNNYDFPSGQSHDTYISEKRYVRGSLNLEAEALAQLKILVEDGSLETYSEGEATEQARLDYAAERLRLLYVGITRAKEELIITWNIGRYRDLQQATPFIALQTLWEGIVDDPAD
jgi:DNA helicase-2/ATP-dependent DNA helicase PcrA